MLPWQVVGYDTLKAKGGVSSPGQKAWTCVEHPGVNTQALTVTFASTTYSCNVLELIFSYPATSWGKKKKPKPKPV